MNYVKIKRQGRYAGARGASRWVLSGLRLRSSHPLRVAPGFTAQARARFLPAQSSRSTAATPKAMSRARPHGLGPAESQGQAGVTASASVYGHTLRREPTTKPVRCAIIGSW